MISERKNNDDIICEKMDKETYSAVPVPTFLLTTISGIHPAGLSKTLTPS